MNVNFEAIEKAWFKPKKTVLDELEEYINKEWNTVATSPDGSFYEGYDCCLEEMKKDILDKIQELKKENENG